MKRVWIAITALVVFGVAFGALVMLAWMIDETHFDRPDEGFDRLAAQIESTPGVSVDARERWVEAPGFSDPNSWIQLTVDETHLPGLLSAACDSEYPDALTWSFQVHTTTGNVVSLYSAAPGGGVATPRCPDFGFDAAGLVSEVGQSLPGLDLQPAIWDNGRFALVVLDDGSPTMSSMLPLVEHAEDVRDAAGLDHRQPVEINAPNLSLIIPPDEHDGYLALLTDLAEKHGVTNYWADDGGTPTNGVEKVQITAPEREHVGITDAIRDSGLHIADFPVRFVPLTP